MCLIIEGFKTKKEALSFKPKIAKKNIQVWKIVDRTDNPNIYISEYKSFIYEKGMHYYQINKKGSPKFGKSAREYIWANNWDLNIHEGLHSFKEKPSPYKIYSDVISIKCTIPKGSEYYESENCIVSDQLIIL